MHCSIANSWPSPTLIPLRPTYEISKANVSVGEAALAQAKASIVQSPRRCSTRRSGIWISAPSSRRSKGVIIDRRVNIGQTVVSSLNAPSLFLIAKDLTKMQIWVAVNEADVGRIVPGGPVTFTCDAFPGKEFSATVGKVRLNATMTQNVVMYTVEVNTENPDNILLPYLTANVHFIVGQGVERAAGPQRRLALVPVVCGAGFARGALPQGGRPGAGPRRRGRRRGADGLRAHRRRLGERRRVRSAGEGQARHIGRHEHGHHGRRAELEGQEVVTGEIAEIRTARPPGARSSRKSSGADGR